MFYLKVTPHIPPTVYLFQSDLTHVVHGLYAWIYVHPPHLKIQYSKLHNHFPCVGTVTLSQ